MSDALGGLGSDVIVTFGIAVLFTLGAILIGRLMYGRRIRRWAKSRKLTLVDWRPAWFYEGPDAFLRSRYRNVFWIEVEDRDGIATTGWLVYSWWPFDTDPEIEWN
jgi:hypothetical protein